MSRRWVQLLRKPGKHAIVCLDGYLSMSFSEEDEIYHRRYMPSALGDARAGKRLRLSI